MWRWADVKMRRCEEEQMWRWADVKMRRCERRCEDEKVWRWEGVRWADVKMRRCEEERWEGVKMRRCEDEKVWRWEDEIQTPTIGRTLRSDALGKKSLLLKNIENGTIIDSQMIYDFNYRWFYIDLSFTMIYPWWFSTRYFTTRNMLHFLANACARLAGTDLAAFISDALGVGHLQAATVCWVAKPNSQWISHMYTVYIYTV